MVKKEGATVTNNHLSTSMPIVMALMMIVMVEAMNITVRIMLTVAVVFASEVVWKVVRLVAW